MGTIAESRAPLAPGPDPFERVQALQERLERLPESDTRRVAEELVSAVVQLYGEGLERLMIRLHDDAAGARAARELAEDPLLGTLLLIHDLHPVPLRERVQAALDSVRPYMESHGGDVELLELTDDGVARIHLQGSCSDCSASAVTLELAIKQALEDAAPDLAELVVEGMVPQLTGAELPMAEAAAAPRPVGLELPVVMSGPAPASAPPATLTPAPAVPPPPPAPPIWYDLDELASLPLGTFTPVTVDGHALVVANVDGTLLAYGDACAACGSALRDGELHEGALACPACGRAFFLPRAGRTMDAERLQLTPVPLLRDRDAVRVALAR